MWVNVQWRDIPERVINRVAKVLQNDITVLLRPHESSHWHHFIPTGIWALWGRHIYLSFVNLAIDRDRNSADIPEGRIRKSTTLFLTFWFIPEQHRGLRRNVAVQPWLPLLYYSLCRVGRGSRDNPQTGAEVMNVRGKLCQLACSLASLLQNVDLVSVKLYSNVHTFVGSYWRTNEEPMTG